MATKKIPAKTIVEAIGSHVGKDGDLFYDTTTNALRISDGSTAGGAAVGFGGALESDAISSANAAFVTINDNVKIVGGLATGSGYAAATVVAKTQTANDATIALVKNVITMNPVDGNACVYTLPTHAASAVGDFILLEIDTAIANGETVKIGTASQFFMAKSRVVRQTGATGSAVSGITSIDLADGTGDDFLNLVGLTNAGPGVGGTVKIGFNGTNFMVDAYMESTGTGIAANLSVFATT